MDPLVPNSYRRSTLLGSEGLPNLVGLFLAAEIGRRQLRSGDRFPHSEEALRKALGVGRGTVHEAWKRLEEKDIVRFQRGVGVIMNNPDGLFREDLVEVFFKIRKEAEIGLIQQVVIKVTDDQLSNMGQIIETFAGTANKLTRAREVSDSRKEMESDLDLLFQLFECDLSFHEEIHKIAQEPWLTMIAEIAEATTQVMWYHGLQFSSGLTSLVDRHREIYDALKARDASAAVRSMESHFDHAYEYGVRALRNLRVGLASVSTFP